jgi:hypothetical protein
MRDKDSHDGTARTPGAYYEWKRSRRIDSMEVGDFLST